MQALQIAAPGQISIIETPRPEPGAGELLIRVSACGICGTDLHIAQGTYMGDYPVIPGHEFSGVVEATGPGVRRIATGTSVAVEPNLPCNNCEACLRNQQNHCENWTAIGVTRPGAMAEYVVVPESAAFPLGDLDPVAGSLMEPLSCVLHGVAKLTVRPGDRVAVAGGGPIGLLLCSVLGLAGARTIILAERNPARRNRDAAYLASIASVEASVVEDASAIGTGTVDIAVDATGAPPAVRETLRMVRAGGQCLWFGVPDRDARHEIEPFVVFEKGLSIHGAFTSLRNSVEAVRVLQSGVINAAGLITRTVGLEDVASVFSELSGQATEELKCIVTP